MRKLFTSTSTDQVKHNGTVEILRQLNAVECDAECQPMYLCRSDAGEFHTFNDELAELPHVTAAIQAYADGMLQHELDHIKQYQPERLAKVTPEATAALIERMTAQATATVAIIQDKQACFEKSLHGTFQTCNKLSRALFAAVTGLTLPKGEHATDAAIEAYCGAEAVAAVRAQRQAAADERTRKEREENEAIAAKELACIKSRFGTGITGDELLTLARHLGVEVHPRTAGMIRKRIVSIANGSARISGKRVTDDAWACWRACEAALSAELATVENNS